MSTLLDVQGVQSRTFGERGVARYLTELAAALERWFPDAVERYLVNPDLPVSGALERLPPPNRVAGVGQTFPGARSYHVGSPFEPDVSLDGLWPAAARTLPLAVSLYDLIPELFPETYLGDPATRRWYRARLELVRRADRVLAISKATAADAIRTLGLPEERVRVVGAAPAEHFKPPASREAALADLRRAFPALGARFLLYTGGIEPRKNIDRLLEAYARLPGDLRRRHTLVIVCRVQDAEREQLERRFVDLGVAGQVLLTGYVTDEQLVSLYGATELFVFPSLYEGYGLPVAEAVACGAPALVSDTSSLVELVREPQARFDPHDAAAIAAALERALTDSSFLERLRSRDAYSIDTWRTVAGRAAAAWSELDSQPRRNRSRRRSRVAYVSPLPPQRSGVADYSYRLLEPLSELCQVDAFVDRTLGVQRAPDGVHLAAIGHFQLVERLRAGYDQVFICLGNSEHHIAALDLLRRRGGVVLAHDVRLSGMYAYATGHRRELERRTFPEILHDMYADRVSAELAATGVFQPEDPSARDLLLAREAIAAADTFVVHSDFAANLARSDAEPGHRDKVRVAPFAFRDPSDFPEAPRTDGPPVVGTFGVVGSVKQTGKLVDAFAALAEQRDCKLVVGGPPAGAEEYGRLQSQVDRLGLASRARLLGYVDDEDFGELVRRTTVAVQLRSMSMGESSASVADCLSAGVATVVSAVGSTRELPDDVLVKVAPDIGVPELAETIGGLLDDSARRRRLGGAAQALARERSFAESARFLYEELVRPAARRLAA